MSTDTGGPATSSRADGVRNAYASAMAEKDDAAAAGQRAAAWVADLQEAVAASLRLGLPLDHNRTLAILVGRMRALETAAGHVAAAYDAVAVAVLAAKRNIDDLDTLDRI